MADTASAPTPPSRLRAGAGEALRELGPAVGLGEVDPGQLVLPLRCTCLLPREKGRVQLKAEEAGRRGPQEGMEGS